MAKLFIGMPVYNGAKTLAHTLNAIRNQSFTDWTLLISDNASTDETDVICSSHCSIDNRISYYRHKHNNGMAANYEFLLEAANAEYFAWVAADDIWHSDFLLSCISRLESERTCGIAFTNIVNIDSDGRASRSYPDFSHFSKSYKPVNLSRFLLAPERFGKANIVYGVYRLDICREVWEVSQSITDVWGFDMCFVLGVLARTGLSIDSRILYEKRLAANLAGDGTNKVVIDNPQRNICLLKRAHQYFTEVAINNPLRNNFPLDCAHQYLRGNLKVVSGTRYYWLVLVLFTYRLKKLELISLIGRINSSIRSAIKIATFR